jgi:putative protease
MTNRLLGRDDANISDGKESDEIQNSEVENISEDALKDASKNTSKNTSGETSVDRAASTVEESRNFGDGNRNADYNVLVNTASQLQAVLDFAGDHSVVSRIYLDSDLFLTMSEELFGAIRELKNNTGKPEFFVALPFVMRNEQGFDGAVDIDKIMDTCINRGFDGVLVRNFEQLGFIRSKGFLRAVILDYGAYNWNSAAARLLKEGDKESSFKAFEASVPYELTIHEARELSEGIGGLMPLSFNVYGRTPMMISAGCVRKTLDNCSGKMYDFNIENLSMIDRMGNRLPITAKCRNCYNIIWNAHPTSLIRKLDNVRKMNAFDHFRIDFTTENKKEVALILDAYVNEDKRAQKELDNMNTTTGHFKRGVE